MTKQNQHGIIALIRSFRFPKSAARTAVSSFLARVKPQEETNHFNGNKKNVQAMLTLFILNLYDIFLETIGQYSNKIS